MDFLDPQKQKQHRFRLTLGYILIGLALAMATTILMYKAYGFGLDRHGRVIQSGLLFLSSQPSGADIYVNGKSLGDQTDTRLNIPAGQYTFELRRDGYRTWKRAITSEGGSVQRFDYPFLFPTVLKTTTTKQYDAQPVFTTQSPDHRWLLVEPAGSADFDEYDLKSKVPAAKLLSVPLEVVSAGTTTTGWQEVEWSKDNRHLLLRRLYQKAGIAGSEYIMLDREEPTSSVNLSILLGFTPTTLKLRDGAYDQYYAYDQNNSALFTATLKKPTPQPYISDVLAFETDGSDTVLYVTNAEAPPGKVLVRVRQGDEVFTLKNLAVDTSYLLELGRYTSAWYVAAGGVSEGKVYVYKEPVAALQKDAKKVLVPVHILKMAAPSYISLGPSKRIIMIESGDSFAVYDFQTRKGYAYQLKLPIDAGMHATWMDSYHFALFSGQDLKIFDYDGSNRQSLFAASPGAGPYFDAAYAKMYSVSILQTTGGVALQSTALLTPADQ